MSKEYTPTTEEVKAKYRTHQGSSYRGAKIRAQRNAEFDRWLANVQAEAWDQGKRAGLRQSDWEHGDTATEYVATNPYRKEKA